MLDAGVILEAIVREILAVSAALKSAVRHLGHHRDVGINPDAAEIKGLGQTHRATVVLGPDR